MAFRRLPPRPRIDYGPLTKHCKTLQASKLSKEQKQWICNEIIDKRQSVKDIAAWSHLTPNYLFKLTAKIRLGATTPGSVGRPPEYDATAIAELAQFIKIGGKSKTAKTEEEFKKEAATKRKEANLRRGGNGLTSSFISTSTMRMLKKKVKAVNTSAAGVRTTARQREESDPRNMVVEGIFLEAFSKTVPPECVINMDAVQYKMGKDGIIQKVIFSKIAEEPLEGPVERNETDLDDLGLFIKVYNQVSSNGTAAPMVHVLACPEMTDTDFAVIKVPGLGATTDAAGYMWVCFTKSRSGNNAFYEWFVQNSVLPYIDLCRTNSCVDNPRVLYSTDGEEIQLRNFSKFSDEFTNRLVALMKHSASCSALTNALDCGNEHKATKKVSKHATQNDVLEFRKAAQSKLDTLLDTHAKFITTKSRRSMITDRILRIVHAYQKALTRDMIIHSFQKSGQLIREGSVHQDFLDSKLALCTTKLTLVQVQACRVAFPELLAIAKLNGKITEAEMDNAGIPKVKDSTDRRSKPKDERPLHNQRAAIVNHDKIQAEFNRYQNSPQVVARRAKTAARKKITVVTVPRVVDVAPGSGFVAVVVPPADNNTYIAANTTVIAADQQTPAPAPPRPKRKEMSVPFQEFNADIFEPRVDKKAKKQKAEVPEVIVYGPAKTNRRKTNI